MEKDLLASLYRHWIWSELMKQSHEKEMVKDEKFYETEKTAEEKRINFFTKELFIFMFIWFGLVFAMCEAFKENKVIIPDIQKDIDEIYNDLKLFRNAIFHVQEKFLSHKFRNLLTNKDFLKKIKNIHDGIRRYLEEEIEMSIEK